MPATEPDLKVRPTTRYGDVGNRCWQAFVTPAAVGAVAYLIVAGSLIAFSAYEWLLTQVPTTTVTSYAYVNPIVAILIGYLVGGETIGARTGGCRPGTGQYCDLAQHVFRALEPSRVTGRPS